MRLRILISALLACASARLIGQATVAPSPSANEVIARMFTHDAQRQTASGGYTGYREYVLDNPGLGKRAQMVVSVTCGLDGTESFRVVSEQGWKTANSRVLRKMLDSESETSRPLEFAKARITSDNYTFQLIEAAPFDGRQAYVIDVTPKRQDEFLFRGRIWVDAEDYALVLVEGDLARSPSFWIRSVHFTQQYRKNGEYWFPWSTTSVNEARIFGKTEVDIHYFDYVPRSTRADRETNPEFAEARYVKR
jgi:hypothetical protein